MKKGTRVSWKPEDSNYIAFGNVISDEDSDGFVLVSCDSGMFEYMPLGFRVVVHCKVTSLTIEQNTP